MSPGISRLSALLDAFSGPFKVWYPLQDTAARYGSPWIFLKTLVPLKSPLSESALSIVYFLPSIPSPQIQRDRCFEHIKAKEVYIIPRNSIVNNILFTFSIVQNAKLYYRKRLKANIRHARAASPESREFQSTYTFTGKISPINDEPSFAHGRRTAIWAAFQFASNYRMDRKIPWI